MLFKFNLDVIGTGISPSGVFQAVNVSFNNMDENGLETAIYENRGNFTYLGGLAPTPTSLLLLARSQFLLPLPLPSPGLYLRRTGAGYPPRLPMPPAMPQFNLAIPVRPNFRMESVFPEVAAKQKEASCASFGFGIFWCQVGIFAVKF